jgi:hypothetical protein
MTRNESIKRADRSAVAFKLGSHISVRVSGQFIKCGNVERQQKLIQRRLVLLAPGTL